MSKISRGTTECSNFANINNKNRKRRNRSPCEISSSKVVKRARSFNDWNGTTTDNAELKLTASQPDLSHLDINQLYATLISSGFTGLPTKSTENTHTIDLSKPQTLKVRNPSLTNALYNEGSVGQTRMESEIKVNNLYEGLPFTSSSNLKEMCNVCYEHFENFYHEDNEVWCVKNALRIGKRMFHPICYEDFKNDPEEQNDTEDELELLKTIQTLLNTNTYCSQNKMLENENQTGVEIKDVIINQQKTENQISATKKTIDKRDNSVSNFDVAEFFCHCHH